MPSLLERAQELVAAGRGIPSGHGRMRRDQRGIQNADLVHGVAEATVVESYEDPDEQPAVPLLQRDRHGALLHVVWGFHPYTGNALVITAYYSGLDRWEPDLITRKQR